VVSDCCHESGYHYRVVDIQDAIICTVWPRDKKEVDGCVNVVVSGFESRRMKGIEELVRNRFNQARNVLESNLEKDTACN